jgi:hypothetical protein
MTRVTAKAGEIGAGTYGRMPGFNGATILYPKIFKQTAAKIY